MGSRGGRGNILCHPYLDVDARPEVGEVGELVDGVGGTICARWFTMQIHVQKYSHQPTYYLLPVAVTPGAWADRCLAKTANCVRTSWLVLGAQASAVRCNTNVLLAERAAVKGPRLRVGSDARQPNEPAVSTTLGQRR